MTTFDEALEAYWNAAYQEGREHRTHDDENRTAQELLTWLTDYNNELSQLERDANILNGVLRDRNAERVISLVAHSATGDYDWAKNVCLDYLNRDDLLDLIHER